MPSEVVDKYTFEVIDDADAVVGRVLQTPDGKRQKYLFEESPSGGYFVQRVLIPGRVTNPISWMVVKAGINAEDIPIATWEQRAEFAEDQAKAFAVLIENDIDPTAPLANLTGHPNRQVRQAVALLESMGYLLLWPVAEVEKLVTQYIETWEENAKRTAENKPVEEEAIT